MGQGVYSVKVDLSGLDRLLGRMPKKAADILDKAARDVERLAKQNAPLDTGALRNSIHVESPIPQNRIVADGVEYGIYQEEGTARGVPAKHFMANALEAVRPSFEKAWKELIG